MLSNVHRGARLSRPTTSIYTSDGEYQYYHYVCDGFDDRGWGCGYRTLQTICSWLRWYRLQSGGAMEVAVPAVPTIREIQNKLVAVGDKPIGFAGSREWIGSVEAAIVCDSLYDVPCKILHVAAGDQLQTAAADILFQHFGEGGSKAPVMMGGDVDASSRGIFGICSDGDRRVFVLIVDPHFVRPTHAAADNQQQLLRLLKDGWVAWQPLDSFVRDSFYNLCLPQLKR